MRPNKICPTALRLTRSTRNGPQQGPESQTLQRQSLLSSTNSLPRTSTGITFACFTILPGRRSETHACKSPFGNERQGPRAPLNRTYSVECTYSVE
jgi:hypothetical protein